MKLMYPQKTGCLCANSHPGSYSGQDAYNDMLLVLDISRSSESENIYQGGVSSTMMARQYKSASDLVVESTDAEKGSEVERKYIVRRLTPLECCRLQGFPDWWTDGAEGSDTAKYRMWGNGIALPCAADALRRVAKALMEEENRPAE